MPGKYIGITYYWSSRLHSPGTGVVVAQNGIAAFTGNDLDNLQSGYKPLSYYVLSQCQHLNQSSHSCFIDCTRTGLHRSVSNLGAVNLTEGFKVLAGPPNSCRAGVQLTFIAVRALLKMSYIQPL